MQIQTVRLRKIVQRARRASRVLFPQKPPSLTVGKFLAIMAMTFLVSAMLVTPHGFAAASDIEFNLDFSPLFSNITTWVNTLMPVYSVPIAISIAVAIIIGVGGLLVGAFKFAKSR